MLTRTKTAASATTILLLHFVVDRLRAHLERQDAERPIVPMGVSLVFMTDDGLTVNGSWFTKHFQQLLRAAGAGFSHPLAGDIRTMPA